MFHANSSGKTTKFCYFYSLKVGSFKNLTIHTLTLATIKMKLYRTNWIKWLGLIILLGLIIWFFYDNFLKFEINNYQAKQIEKRLQKNFKENQDDFQDLMNYSKHFPILENLVFGDNEFISFQVYDSLVDIRKNDHIFIMTGEKADYHIQDIKFLDGNTISVLFDDQQITHKNWTIDFQGKMTEQIVEKLLFYNNISIDQLENLKQKLDKINCSGFNKNKNSITIRYIGHWGESFNYIIPLRDSIDKDSWNKLDDNYYWEHYVNGLFCGWTDW